MFQIRRLFHAGLLLALTAGSQAQLLSPESQRPTANSYGSSGTQSNTAISAVPNQATLNERSSNTPNTSTGRADLNGTGLVKGMSGSKDDDLPAALRRAASEQSVPRNSTTEFSRYASKLTGQSLRVFGSEFFFRLQADAPNASPVVPPDYVVNAGDELLIQISGSVEDEFKQQVRRGGDITLPKVGAVRLAGVPAGEVAAVIRRRLETQFRNIQVSVSFVALRGMRVFVTGFVENPGPRVVDSLSTITTAISAAGGPAEGGSHRITELWRGGRKIATFDLYKLLVLGDNSTDLTLTAGDVLNVAPASSFQVALTGSVNRPAVYELLPGETMDNLLRYAGGFTPVADRQRYAAVQIDTAGLRRLVEQRMDSPAGVALSAGSVLHVFSGASLRQGSNTTSKIVHVEGEVKRPGSYVLAVNSSLKDAIAAAGGPTAEAFLSGLTLTRQSLAQAQEVQYNRSLDELERSLFETYLKSNSNLGDSAQASVNHVQVATRSYIERLRQFKPTGRLILSKTAVSGETSPELLDGDRVQIPPMPSAISVFGAVFGEGSYRVKGNLPLEALLNVAGGLRDGADANAIVVLKADGSFVPAPKKSFFGSKTIDVEPGDTVLVPTDTDRPRYWAIAKDIGTLLYQFGLGAIAIQALH